MATLPLFDLHIDLFQHSFLNIYQQWYACMDNNMITYNIIYRFALLIMVIAVKDKV